MKNLKLNKKRTISTIIGILLSCSLICAVATMVMSFQATLIENATNETGYYHLQLCNVSNEQIRALKNHRKIEQVWSIFENGYGKLENGQNEDKPYLKLYSMEKTAFEDLKFNLIEGKFPTNEKEIIISKHISDNGKVDYQLGDKINLKIGKRETLDGYSLVSANPYDKEDEQLVDTQDYEFTIVGIIERPDYTFEDYSDPGYTIITTNNKIGNQKAYITLKNPKQYKTSISEILGASSYDEIGQGDEPLNYDEYSINRELLRWEAFAFSDDTVLMLYTVAGIVIVIILVTSVFCIRNSFAIATTEKMKMYGMLASIGATKKQIKKNVIMEAFLLGIVGIPARYCKWDFCSVCLDKSGEFDFGRLFAKSC